MRFDKWNILSFCFMWQVFKSLLDYCFHTCLSVNTLNNSKVTTESGNCFTQYPWKYPYLRVLSPGCIRFFLLKQSSPHPYRIISSLFKMLLSPFSTPPPPPPNRKFFNDSPYVSVGKRGCTQGKWPYRTSWSFKSVVSRCMKQLLWEYFYFPLDQGC